MILAYSIRAFNIKSYVFSETLARVFEGYHSESEPYPAKALTAPAASGWATFAPLTVILPFRPFRRSCTLGRAFPRDLSIFFCFIIEIKPCGFSSTSSFIFLRSSAKVARASASWDLNFLFFSRSASSIC
eukprot:symbB.v1.2.035554.t1/scaffold4817.1/size34381/2